MSNQDDSPGERQRFDRKSLRLVHGRTADWDELAKDCVCFANAAAGVIEIGVEDDAVEPPPDWITWSWFTEER